jgi:hypothetical protein
MKHPNPVATSSHESSAQTIRLDHGVAQTPHCAHQSVVQTSSSVRFAVCKPKKMMQAMEQYTRTGPPCFRYGRRKQGIWRERGSG